MNHFFRSRPFKRALKLTSFCFLALVIIGVAVGVWYGAPSAPIAAEQISCSSLTLGESFSISQVINETDYKPLWLTYEKASFNVEVKDKDGAFSTVDTELILSYDKNEKLFTAKGIGEGNIIFRSNIDENVSFKVPFKVEYKSPHTAGIIEENYKEFLDDGFLSSEEISKITSITVEEADVDAADFAMFPELKTVYLDCNKTIPKMTNLKLGWEFFVPIDEYRTVLATAEWAPYNKYIFPDINKPSDSFEVVFDPMGGDFFDTANFEETLLVKNFYIFLADEVKELNAKDFIPERKGYTFNGWMLYGNEKAGIPEEVLPEKTELVQDLKVFAEWNEHKYSIKFDVSGGSGSVDERRLKYSEKYTPDISKISREGHDFMGWSKTENGDVQFKADETLVSLTDEDASEITLYAIWRPDIYHAEFYDGSTLVDTEKNIGYFDKFNIIDYKAPAKVGMSFLGWSQDPSAVVPEYNNGSELSRLTDEYGKTIKFYTVWDSNRYTVQYDANGGTDAPEAQTVKYEEVGYIPLTEPTRYGYTFEGWNTSSTATKVLYTAGGTYENLSSINGAKITLYAIWKPDTFTIKFNSNGATNGSADKKRVEYGSSHEIKITDFYKTGYYIIGWATEPNSTVSKFKANHLTISDVNKLYAQAIDLTDKSVDLYPIWDELTYRITFDLKSGTMSGDTSRTMDYTQKLTLPTPTKAYYNFDGWYCKYNSLTYNAGDEISGKDFDDLVYDDKVQFTAQWELAKYDITYDFNGGAGSPPDTITVSVNDYVKLINAPSREGYTFQGWKCSVDDNTYAAGTNDKNWADSKQKSVTFTAQWKENPTT